VQGISYIPILHRGGKKKKENKAVTNGRTMPIKNGYLMTYGRQVTAVVMEIYQTRADGIDDKRFGNGSNRQFFFPIRRYASENVDQVTLLLCIKL